MGCPRSFGWVCALVLAGAAIGAGVGALSGAAVGSSLDEIEARNRAMIEAHMGRQIAAGAVTNTAIIHTIACNVFIFLHAMR